MRLATRLGTLFACCLWGAITGWAAALAVARPEPPPAATLLAYGAIALFGAGYLLGSALRGRTVGAFALRAAAFTAATALAVKVLAPALAAWVAVLVAAAVFGVLCGLVRTHSGPGTGPRSS